MRIRFLTSIFILLATILHFGCSTNEHSNKKAEGVKILYVNPHIESFLPVKCENFENELYNNIKFNYIANRTPEYDTLTKYIDTATKHEGLLNLNTRMKIFLYENGIIKYLLCLDGVGRINIVNHNKYFYNDHIFYMLAK